MIDPTAFFNKQLSDFLCEYKTRFTQINHNGMPGKIGYSTKLTRSDVNCSLNVYLTERFPIDPPLIYVIPKFNHECLDGTGRVM